jgi:ParB family chromosome partitioning protein
MSKRDELRKNVGGNMAESVGVGVTLGVPAGMTPEAAPGRPGHLEGVSRVKHLVEIAITQIIRDECQPREHFSETELDELTASITARGLLQPIRVRWHMELNKYVIVAGERRWRACRMAGLKAVPCIIHEGAMTESAILQDQIVENMLRQDLRPIEQAKAYRKLMELEGWSARHLARELHIPDASVARAMALLDLPEEVQQQVEAGQIAPSVAYQVSQLDRPADQAELAERVIAEKLTREQVSEAVKAKKAGREAPAKRARMEFAGDRVKVTITGEAVAAGDHEAIAAMLRDALDQVSAEKHGSAHDQAA